MGSPVTNGSLSRFLQPGLEKVVGLNYKETEHEYKELFDSRRSDKNQEIQVGMAPTGFLTVKTEGGNISYDDFMQGFTRYFTHVVYGSGFIITREAIEDNQYKEVATARSSMLARSAKETKENVAANVLNRAFNSSYTGADGVELCSTVNKLAKGGTFRNELEVAADLSEASLEQMVIDIKLMTDDAGKKIAVRPKKLVVPDGEMFNAERILGSVLQSHTSNNALNALKAKGVLPEGYCVNRYLTDNKAFFILTDQPDCLIHFQRRDLELQNDTDFDSENMKFKLTERYSFGFHDKRGVFGSAGS